MPGRAWAALPALATLLACGCGEARRAHRSHAGAATARPALAVGLTEGDARLLRPPAGAAAAADPLLAARRALSSLRPGYLRLLVDWAALQPDPQRPPAFGARVAGCARAVGPCAPFDGIRAELDAIASRQRASGGLQVLVDILGAPAWALAPAHGCEYEEAPVSAMTIRPAALAGYRALIAGLLALGRQEGVRLTYWSPWNEPNDPRFVNPQRAACTASAAPLAPAAYAQLADAMSAELAAQGGEHQLVLGELGGYLDGSAHRLGVGEFVAALPASLVCATDVWSVHAYSRWGARGSAPDPVPALEAALASRRAACPGPAARIWITEAGAGAEDPGHPREGSASEGRRGCLALASSLAGWARDPSVAAVFQYTFRDDPAFPVGLASANLSRLYPSYELWLRLAQGAPVDGLAAACR